MKTIGILFVLAFALIAQADDEVWTREELFAPVNDPTLSPEKHYAEIDLNGDGTNDLIVSESISLGGGGGLIYNLYLTVGQNSHRHLGHILAGVMAVEIHEGVTRLWSYSHCSSQAGSVRYCYFDHNGTFRKSPALTILTGDGGSKIGNAMYKSIFNEKTILKTKRMGAFNK